MTAAANLPMRTWLKPLLPSLNGSLRFNLQQMPVSQHYRNISPKGMMVNLQRKRHFAEIFSIPVLLQIVIDRHTAEARENKNVILSRVVSDKCCRIPVRLSRRQLRREQIISRPDLVHDCQNQQCIAKAQQ